MTTSTRRLALGTVLAALVAAGCGDDGGGGSKPPPPGPGAQPATAGQPAKAPAGGAAAPKKAGGKKELVLKVYGKVEDKAAGKKEAWALRREFQADDLRDDPSAKDNRDPFRSFVIRQVIASVTDTATQTTPVCTERNMRAPNPEAQDPRAKKSYSLRDLRLGGIVLRGARSYALFVDTTGYGHVVRKDDCVGKEKGRVVAIGAGYVKMEVTPEPGPSTVGAGPQAKTFELHPEELQLDEEGTDEGGDTAPTQPETKPEEVKEGTTDEPKQP